MSEPNTAIPKGSWILVTGVNGYVGSQVAKHFLERGYKVRGTVRDPARAAWLVDDVFKPYAENGALELVQVEDLAAPHAFDTAIVGVSSVIHVASVVTISPDPNEVIPQTVAGATAILDAALREPAVKSFVYTSSYVATTMPVPGNHTIVGLDTWNETAVQLAWAPPPYTPDRGIIVYMASKVAAEKAVWKFVEEKKPHFKVHSVNPSNILGEPLHESHAKSRAHWARAAFDGDAAFLSQFSSIFSVNVRDVAALHVAAALDPDLPNSRIQAWAQPCNWNDVLGFERKLFPDHKLIDPLPQTDPLTISTDFTLPLSLLKKWYGQDGWISLEQTIAEDLKPIVAWRAQKAGN